MQDDHTNPTLSREGKWEKTERKESRGKVKGGRGTGMGDGGKETEKTENEKGREEKGRAEKGTTEGRKGKAKETGREKGGS